MKHANMTPTEAIAHFIVDTKFEDIPEAAILMAKRAITDFCGVAMAATKGDIAQKLTAYIKENGGVEDATVFGSGYKTTLEQAAMTNGAIAHALDYDDWSMTTIGHPSVFLVPTLFALSEKYGFTGKDILKAYVIGFECVSALTYKVIMRHFDQGWHPTGTVGAYGAAAAASALMGLSVEETRRALGMGCSMAAGIRANNGTETKPLHAGNAAANGIKAVRLAKLGYTSEQNIIDIVRGYVYSFGYTEELNWDEMLDNLGEKWMIISDKGLNIKPYPSCGGTAFGIDAVKEILANNKFDLADITEIELWVNTIAHLPLIHHNPTKGLQGKFSMEYTAARALVSGNVTLDDFTDEKVNEPIIKELESKMKWVVKYPQPSKEGKAEEFDPKGIKITLKDGRVLTSEVFIHVGMPSKPMPKEVLEAKFYDCAHRTLTDDEIKNALAILGDFENLKDIKVLMKALQYSK